MSEDDRSAGNGNSGEMDGDRRNGQMGRADQPWSGRSTSPYGRPRLSRRPHAHDTSVNGSNNREAGTRPATRPAPRGPRQGLDTRFEPTLESARQRLERVRPSAYAKTRNFVDGAVTLLSPYLTHGFLNVPHCVEQLSMRHTLTLEDKLIYEFAWREYFHHVWSRLGDGILNDIRGPVWRGRYDSTMPDDIVHGATGVAVIDTAVRKLYAEGYLHNHMRMWLASYIVHIRKVDWKAGAAWMYAHLLDGDLASNWLSWQWVSGTFAHKPYLFNADNVSRYFAGMDCSGTAIDTTYVDLEAIARGYSAMGPEPGTHPRVEQPPRFSGDLTDLLTQYGLSAMNDAALQARLNRSNIDVRHPWDLGPIRTSSEQTIGWLDINFHQRFAWSHKRWDFVLRRMREMTDTVWLTDSAAFARNVPRTHSLQGTETLAPGYTALRDYGNIHFQPAPRFFANPLQLQPSFTRFFDHAMAGRELSLSPPSSSRFSA